ncbi:MAG: O-antigen ligase family protein [Clostridia bacterium]|nr:O-antigen ligase family protein [Clostridia bacterium]
MFIKGVRSVLESEWLVPIVFLFAMAGQIFNFITYSLSIIVGLIILILFLCEDVKNVVAIILYAPFYIKNIFYFPQEKLFTIAVVVAILALLVSATFKIAKCYKNNLFKRGEFYVALAVSTVAYLLGGIISNFSFERFITILMFCSASLLFYFLALNSTKDLARFMYKTFVWGALMVTFEIFIHNYMEGGVSEIFSRYFIDVGAENVNVAALFILLGVCGAFGIGYRTKYDGAFFVLAVYFVASIFITRSRMIIFLSCVTLAFFTVICFLDSPNKKSFTICFCGLLALVFITAAVNVHAFVEIFDGFSEKNGLSGRDRLWKWCVQKFKEYPVFGIGFIFEDGAPSANAEAARYVLAHNTVIQWLCSLGIFGTLLMLYYTFKKYQILSRSMNVEFILRFTLIMIAVSGIVDQAAQMDPFILNITIVVIAALENLERNEEKERYINTYGYKRIIQEAELKR